MSEDYHLGAYNDAYNINCSVQAATEITDISRNMKIAMYEFAPFANSTDFCFYVNNTFQPRICSGSRNLQTSYGPFESTSGWHFSMKLANSPPFVPHIRFWMDITISPEDETMYHMECLSHEVIKLTATYLPNEGTTETGPIATWSPRKPSDTVTVIIVVVVGSLLLLALLACTFKTDLLCRNNCTKVSDDRGGQRSSMEEDHDYTYIEFDQSALLGLTSQKEPSIHRFSVQQIAELSVLCRSMTELKIRRSQSTQEIYSTRQASVQAGTLSIQQRALPLTPIERANIKYWKSADDLYSVNQELQIVISRFQKRPLPSVPREDQNVEDAPKNPHIHIVNADIHNNEQHQGDSDKDDEYMPPIVAVRTKLENEGPTQGREPDMELTDDPQAESNQDDEDAREENFVENEYIGLSQEALANAAAKERKRGSLWKLYTLLPGGPSAGVDQGNPNELPQNDEIESDDNMGAPLLHDVNPVHTLTENDASDKDEHGYLVLLPNVIEPKSEREEDKPVIDPVDN